MTPIGKGGRRLGLVACLIFILTAGIALAADQPGDIKGTTLEPTPENLAATWSKASLVLPAALAGGHRWQGFASAAPEVAGKAPLVVLLHGSSGVAPAVKDFQIWLADALGLASVAPDSLAIPDRLIYTSPVSVDIYERVTEAYAAMRAETLPPMLEALDGWAEKSDAAGSHLELVSSLYTQAAQVAITRRHQP